jgi:heat shock 70kDa protein 1/2/6/8
MVQATEKYKAEDEAAASRILAKNGLQSYVYNPRNTLTDDKLASKFDLADKTELESAVNETISWLDCSQEASKEEYASTQKEIVGGSTCILQDLLLLDVTSLSLGIETADGVMTTRQAKHH